jgi:DNA-binding protein
MTDEVITNEVTPEIKPEAVPAVVAKRDDRNTVFIGSKPFMNYVTAVVMQFTTQNANTVFIRPRGKFISKAVDVAEVVKRRFMMGQIATEEVKIGSEGFENSEGRQVSVSTIDIALIKSI